MTKPTANVARSLVGFTVATACLLAGCAPKHVALNEETAQHIKSVKVISVMPQNGVVPTVPPTTGETTTGIVAGLFGFVGLVVALPIMTHIQQSHYHAAEQKLAPLTNHTGDIDAHQDFADGMRLAADGSDRLSVHEEMLVSRIDSYNFKQMLKEMKEDALLIVTTKYYFSPDFRVLNVRNHVELWPKDADDPIYRGDWYVHSMPFGSHEEQKSDEQAVAAWAENQAAAYRAVEHEVVEETELMERIELLHSPVQKDLGRMSLSYAEPMYGQTRKADGKIILRQNGWLIVRTEDGNLHALQSPQEPTEPVAQGSPAPETADSAPDQSAPSPVQESGSP